MEGGTIYRIDGGLMSDTVAADNRAFLYGDGLFETVRVEEGRALFIERHRQRFSRSARRLQYPDPTIDSALESLDSLDGRRDGLWRVTVSRPATCDEEEAQSRVHLRWRQFRNGDGDGATPTLGIVENFYFPEFDLFEHKTTSWLRSLEARRRAQNRGYDEALLISPGGRVGEAAAANIFLRIGGEWVTPPVEGILPGVMRDALLAAARQGGLKIVERPVFVGDLQTCEAMALTSTGRMVTAVSAVEKQPLETEPVEELIDVFQKYLKWWVSQKDQCNG